MLVVYIQIYLHVLTSSDVAGGVTLDAIGVIRGIVGVIRHGDLVTPDGETLIKG